MVKLSVDWAIATAAKTVVKTATPHNVGAGTAALSLLVPITESMM
jgi:hypothetical protein